MSDERRILTPVRKALLEAADYIEAHGWAHGCARDGQRCCVAVAINEVVKERADPYRAAIEAGDQLRRYLNFYRDLPSWNDAPERTQAEVVAALRGAAVVVGS